MMKSALVISKALFTKTCLWKFEALTVVPTDTFDQFDARVYPRTHKYGDKDRTQYIAYRLLVSSVDRVDEVARHTRWWHPRRYYARITHSVFVEFSYCVWITARGWKKIGRGVVDQDIWKEENILSVREQVICLPDIA